MCLDLSNADYNQTRKLISQQYLDCFKKVPTDFMRRFVTMNESWFTTLCEIKQWVAPKKRSQLHILIDYLDEKNHAPRPELQKKRIIFHQDNAPAHKSSLTTGKLKGLKYELFEHALYSPYLVFSGFYLFSNPKKFLAFFLSKTIYRMSQKYERIWKYRTLRALDKKISYKSFRKYNGASGGDIDFELAFDLKGHLKIKLRF